MSFENVPNFLLNLFETEMSGKETPCYRFNSFLLDVAERQLLRHDKPIPLTPKAFDVLVYLIEHAGHLVLKDQLMQTVWPDSFVDEVNVPRTIHTIRATLGENGNGNKFIETVPTKGYRFVAHVDEVNGNGPVPRSPDSQPRAVDTQFDPDHNGSVDPLLVTSGHREVERDQSRSGGKRSVLIVTSIVILAVVAISGSWFNYRSSPAKTSPSQASKVQTNNGEAYQLYQQGRVLIERGYDGDIDEALANFERAVELDPSYASAYVGKADAKIQTFWYSKLHDDISQARTAINRAIELDSLNSYAHTMSCRLKATYEWDFSGADKECRLAIDLDPTDAEAHREMAFFLNSFGREAEAMQEIDAAVMLAPTSFNKRSRGVILYYSRRYDDAIEQLQQVVETDPKKSETLKWLMFTYEMNKDYTGALEARIRQLEHQGATPEEVAAVRTAFNESGWPGVLRKMVDPLEPRKVGLGAAAPAFAQLGSNEEAFKTLEKMFDNRAILLVQMGREPRFDPIRHDPHFDNLLKRIGLK